MTTVASRAAPGDGVEARDALDAPRACFAPCPRGLEDVLVDELGELGIGAAHATAGGVHCTASLRDTWRINLHSRIASRVLVRVAQARYRTDDDVHRLAKAQDWMRWFTADRTLRVDVTGGSGRQKSPLKSLEFVTLRIKDGICDRFRDAVGSRPDIDTRQPDVRVYAYLDATTCTLYLDTSGEPLFKRGWRSEAGDAPLRENLAAGILRLAGWTPGIALLDPMCGSGTFVVEAAQAALGIAPGETRYFGFERLNGFDPIAWEAMREAAASRPDAAAIDALSTIRGSDVSGDAVTMTRANLVRAGVPDEHAAIVAPKQVDARQVRPHAEQGIVVMNPPYGERIAVRGERTARQGDRGRGAARWPAPSGDRDGTADGATDDALDPFFAEFGDTLKQRFAGWTAHVLTSDMALQKKLRLAPDRRVVLFNGAIECRLYRFAVVAGQHR